MRHPSFSTSSQSACATRKRAWRVARSAAAHTLPLPSQSERSLCPRAESVISGQRRTRGMIVDRSYHRLLHLDWILGDVDGDGRREYVPHDDQAGPRPPERSYELFAAARPTMERGKTRRFYFGGKIYQGWSTVPDRHKVRTSPNPGASHS